MWFTKHLPRHLINNLLKRNTKDMFIDFTSTQALRARLTSGAIALCPVRLHPAISNQWNFLQWKKSCKITFTEVISQTRHTTHMYTQTLNFHPLRVNDISMKFINFATTLLGRGKWSGIRGGPRKVILLYSRFIMGNVWWSGKWMVTKKGSTDLNI